MKSKTILCLSEQGSRALAILKTVELNGQWNQLWSPQIYTG
ncbi:hypothetical protein [Acaryochloris sp. IP29b_bin.137]|nr:hypothetical protein [Acaryochloris sp. IP29b_bin.137]